MNRIVDFNEDLLCHLEPGVTQTQLYEFLRERGSALWMDATGSSPRCSIIGNTVERGFGHTPHGDHFANVCGLEVVLANGDWLRTGFGRFANANAAPVYRWGVGPYLDGLFTQSNLGIVTQMTVWLMPAPEYFQAFFSIAEDSQLQALVDTLRAAASRRHSYVALFISVMTIRSFPRYSVIRGLKLTDERHYQWRSSLALENSGTLAPGMALGLFTE
jgi:4-cresol dehydrogenase (hydroxylating)